MHTNIFKSAVARAGLAVSLLLAGGAAAYAQQQINLTAGPANAAMPDGTTVPMWGYSCGTVVSGSNATCAALNPNAGAGWSPVVITVPAGSAGGLSINLTNNLKFGAGGATTIPTSITIVGQVGGGLGSLAQRTTVASPTHATQSVTWPTANSGPTNVPPNQLPRVQSFATEVAAGSTTLLPPWPLLKPGTYLIESGTHPSIQGPMGLYGILVVTSAPTFSGTAPATTETAAGCAYPVVNVAASSAACNGTGVPAGVNTYQYDAEVPMLLSEIDPVQNETVTAAVNAVGFTETAVWSGQQGGCGNPTSSTYLTCYPPAVNYMPLYYTVNGVPFNKGNTSGSVFKAAPATINPVAATTSATGNVLVRIVNAGLKMHVPSIVGSQVAGATGGTNPIVTGFKVIAEDGNPLPGVPKIRSEIFMAAGKTYDVMINGEGTTGTTVANYPKALALFDRELSLSGNQFNRDSGMLAYISINGALAPVATGTAASAVPAKAVNDSYIFVPGQILSVTDQSKGVMANDVGVYTAQLLAAPASGTVTMNSNGTFAYYPNAGSAATTDTFTYCANGLVTGTTCSSGLTATVTLGATTVADAGITCVAGTFNSTMATYLAVKTPGVLAGCKDAANLPLSVNVTTATASGGATVHADLNGGFTISATAAGTYTATFTVQNTKQQTATTTATVVFPAGSGLTVKVLDGADKITTITDYRWIIEEDKTFYVDPNCQTNPPATGCPSAASGIVPTLGVNFHTSHMPFVAQGCTGTVSCEGGQTVLGSPVVCDVGNGACRADPASQGFKQVLPSQVALDPTKRYYISILPGDAANPFIAGNGGSSCQYGASTAGGNCGHGMGGTAIAAACKPVAPATTCTGTFAPVTVLTQPSPYPPG